VFVVPGLGHAQHPRTAGVASLATCRCPGKKMQGKQPLVSERKSLRARNRERGLEPTLDVAMECFPSRAGPEREKRGDGVKEKGQCGLPFIEPRSGHVSQLQQVAGATVITLGDVFWQFLLRIGSWLLHKISSLIYTVQFLYRT
jgi:hypothetical protein